MVVILSYFRLILFAAGVLVGIQLPAFVDLYGQRLEAHYLESERNLSEFQDEADKFFGGKINRLVTHYKNSPDTVFQDGGSSIEAIFRRNEQLKEKLADYNQGLLNACVQTFIKPLDDVRNEAAKGYSYSIKLDVSAIAFGLAIGFIVALLCEIVLRSVGMVLLSLKQGFHSAR